MTTNTAAKFRYPEPPTGVDAPGLSAATCEKGNLQRWCLALLREHERDGALPTSDRFIIYELIQLGVVLKSQMRGHPGLTGRGVDQNVNEAIKTLRDVGAIPW